MWLDCRYRRRHRRQHSQVVVTFRVPEVEKIWKMFWNKNVYNKYIALRNFKLMLLRVHAMCAAHKIQIAYAMPVWCVRADVQIKREAAAEDGVCIMFEQIIYRKPYSKYIKLIVGKWQHKSLSEDDGDDDDGYDNTEEMKNRRKIRNGE